MSEELKPCPFCGEIPILTEEMSETDNGFYIEIKQVKCPKCHAKIIRSDGTINAWNTRVGNKND